MARLIGLLPTVTAFAAFILGILCLFAGTKSNFMASVDILTLYTPEIGNAAGAHDFYSIYVMSYCKGSIDSDDKKDRRDRGDKDDKEDKEDKKDKRSKEDEDMKDKDRTGCSKRSILFSFNPSEVLLEEAGNDASLHQLGWPSTISDDFRAFKVTNQSLGVFYCMGVGLAGLALLERLFFLLFQKTRQSAVEFVSLLIGFVVTSIASIISTVIMFQFVSLVNYHGETSDVTAKYGRQFLAMTWAAAGLLLVGSVASLAMVLVDRGRAERAPPPRPDTPKSEMGRYAESVRSR